MNSKNWMQNNSWEEIKNKIQENKGVALIPWGSLEQHGLHLPIGTDSYVAATLAEDGAEKTGALITPVMFPGWCPQHMILPGTITIRPEVLIQFLFDMIASLTKHGFSRFIIINGHRLVNIYWMTIAAEQAQRELKVLVKIFDPAYMSKDIMKELSWGPIGHADEQETSHMLARFPDLVHLDRAIDNPILESESDSLYSVDPNYTHDTLNYVPNTVEYMAKHNQPFGGGTGTPSQSSAEKGKIYHEHVVKNLVTVIKNLQSMEQ